MTSLHERYRLMLASAHHMLEENVRALTLEEALFSNGGHRSILGVLKHTGGWATVYHSYAFGPSPGTWGGTAPLSAIVSMVTNHLAYHTGELNMLLSIAREEAWEWGEEVEENHIDTWGHGVRGPWMTDEIAAHYQDRLRSAREARLGRRASG